MLKTCHGDSHIPSFLDMKRRIELSACKFFNLTEEMKKRFLHVQDFLIPLLAWSPSGQKNVQTDLLGKMFIERNL